MLGGQSGIEESLIGGRMNTGMGQSMFETFGQPPAKFGPSADDMAAAMQKAQVYRKADMKEVCVRTYDLSDEKELVQYQLDLEHILIGIPLRTHLLLCRLPPQFVSDEKGSRYIAHMQWVEFTLSEKPAPSTASK